MNNIEKGDKITLIESVSHKTVRATALCSPQDISGEPEYNGLWLITDCGNDEFRIAVYDTEGGKFYTGDWFDQRLYNYFGYREVNSLIDLCGLTVRNDRLVREQAA